MSLSTPQSKGGLPVEGHPARWAWISLALLPVAAILAVVVAFAIGGLLDLDMFTDSDWTAGEYALVYGAAALVIVVPPAVGTAFGVRAARDGTRSGRWALIINGAVLAVVVLGSVYGLVTAVTNRM